MDTDLNGTVAGEAGGPISPNPEPRTPNPEPPMELDRLYDGDCLALFPGVGDGTVDLIFADPPFNIGYDYDIYDARRDGVVPTVGVYHNVYFHPFKRTGLELQPRLDG